MPLLLELFQKSLDALILSAVLVTILFQLTLTLLVLAQAFLELLLFLLQRLDGAQQVLSSPGALLLFFASSRIGQPLPQPAP